MEIAWFLLFLTALQLQMWGIEGEVWNVCFMFALFMNAGTVANQEYFDIL